MTNELRDRLPDCAVLVEQQGWTDTTLLGLAIRFIDDAGQGQAFNRFLANAAAAENGEDAEIVYDSTEEAFAAGLATLARQTATESSDWIQVPRQPASGGVVDGEERWFDHGGQGIAASILVRAGRVVAIESEIDETVRA